MNGKANGKYLAKLKLDGKLAVVTGACGFLGQHFVEGLKEMGATVVSLDLENTSKAENFYSCDVANAESVKKTFLTIEQNFGPIHVLINNAATKGKSLEEFFKAYTEFSPDVWRQIMSVNIDGMFFVAQNVLENMKKHKTKGSIIQISSIYGMMGPDPRIYEGSEYLGRSINTPAVYSASKAAVHGLTRHFACTLGTENIRVNTLVPGGVFSGQNDQFVKKYSARIPLNRMANPEEIVSAALYLASDASSYVTGQALMVDGGLSSW